MLLAISWILVSYLLFQPMSDEGDGPGGGGLIEIEACICLKLDGTKSCLSEYGEYPALPPAPVNCGIKLCFATVPPTCNQSAPNDWISYIDESSWITEHVKYAIPDLGEKGMERKNTGIFACTTQHVCVNCILKEDVQPPGYYCRTFSSDDKVIFAYGLCTNAKECDGW